MPDVTKATTDGGPESMIFLGIELQRAAFWAEVLLIIFGIVVAGLAALVFHLNKRVDAAKDTSLARFQAESKSATAAADARAAEADQKAAEARERAASAEGGTAKALSDVASASERARKLELEVAEQRERAAAAERDLLSVQRKLEPRRIGRISGEQLIEALRTAKPKGQVEITCVMGDGEGNAFAEQLDQILKGSGWPTSGVSQAVYSGGNPSGWGILVKSLATAPQHAASLQMAFRRSGFPLQIIEKPEMQVGTVQMIVGNKEK